MEGNNKIGFTYKTGCDDWQAGETHISLWKKDIRYGLHSRYLSNLAFLYRNIYRKMKIEVKHIANLEMEYWRKFDRYFQFIKFLKKFYGNNIIRNSCAPLIRDYVISWTRDTFVKNIVNWNYIYMDL